jgi:hypothetical protein
MAHLDPRTPRPHERMRNHSWLPLVVVAALLAGGAVIYAATSYDDTTEPSAQTEVERPQSSPNR